MNAAMPESTFPRQLNETLYTLSFFCSENQSYHKVIQTLSLNPVPVRIAMQMSLAVPHGTADEQLYMAKIYNTLIFYKGVARG